MAEPNFARVSAILTSYWKGAVVHAAVKVGLFEALAEGIGTLEALSERTGSVPEILIQVLYCLQRMNLIYIENSLWKTTADGEVLSQKHPLTLAASSQMWWHEHLDAWRNLDITIQTGEPSFEHIFGEPFFQWLEKNTDQRRLYHDSMSEYAKIDYQRVPELICGYPVTKIIDIGGGHGALANRLAINDPNLDITVLDLSNVIEDTKTQTQNKVKYVAGDFFALPEGDYDCVILSRILHDWDNKHCISILEEVNKLLSKKGIVFIIERLDMRREYSLINLDLAITTKGVERSLKEYNDIFKKTGYKIENIHFLLNRICLIIIKTT